MSGERDAQLELESAIILGIDRPGTVLMAWHLVAAYRGIDDEDGSTSYWQVGPPGQPSYVAHGLMAEGQAHTHRTSESE